MENDLYIGRILEEFKILIWGFNVCVTLRYILLVSTPIMLLWNLLLYYSMFFCKTSLTDKLHIFSLLKHIMLRWRCIYYGGVNS